MGDPDVQDVITGKMCLNWGAKGLLDLEAARAIVEHWLSQGENTEIIQKGLQQTARSQMSTFLGSGLGRGLRSKAPGVC